MPPASLALTEELEVGSERYHVPMILSGFLR